MLFRHGRGCRIQIILGVSFMEFGGLASALQPVSLAHLDDSVQLCDSIHQTPSQVQGHPLYIDNRQRCPCPMSRDRPLSQGCDRVSPVPPAKMKSRFYSPFFIIPKKDSTKTVQHSPLWAMAASPHLHKGQGICPFCTMGEGHQSPHLTQRLAYIRSLARSVV